MPEIKELEPLLSVILSLASVIGLGVLIYRTFHDPDEKAAKDIAVIQQRKTDFKELCDLRHNGIDENISRLAKALELIQVNDLKHIEGEVRSLKENQVKIFTILDERLPKKQ